MGNMPKFSELITRMESWWKDNRGYVVLAVAWVFVATAGMKAGISNCGMEEWFVFAAGISNLLALFDLGPQAFKDSHSVSTRTWLTFELLFFSVVLGVDVKLASGDYETPLLIAATVLVVASTILVGRSAKPSDHIGTFASALLFSVSLFLIPPLLKWLTPLVVGFVTQILPTTNSEHICSAMVSRSYAWVHLLAIPGVYLLVDSRVGKKEVAWKSFLFLDRSLLLAGVACTLSGWFFALLGSSEQDSPLYEAGAAAIILLVGNSWYLSIKKDHTHGAGDT